MDINTPNTYNSNIHLTPIKVRVILAPRTSSTIHSEYAGIIVNNPRKNMLLSAVLAVASLTN
jgi:hypothetical protein